MSGQTIVIGRHPISIAMVGTRGVPARYGGFETCVEEVGARMVRQGHDVRVYCRASEQRSEPTVYRGMNLVRRPAVQKRSLETLSHTALSVSHLRKHRTDVAIVFNAANAPLLPVLRQAKIPVATHVDGIEWMRAKWGPIGSRYYRVAERLAVKWSDALIADSTGIQDYYDVKFGASTDLISYGAPRIDDRHVERLSELKLEPRGYHLVVARFEPENNVKMIVNGYCATNATRPLVVVGSAPYSNGYISEVYGAADDRVNFVGGIWDQDLLDQLYVNAFSYIHGHSVGGTNPSLLRAIGGGATTFAYDSIFNREVLDDAGVYFVNSAQLSALITGAESDEVGAAARGRASALRAELYDWDDVADRYEQLCLRLASKAPRRIAPSQASVLPVVYPERRETTRSVGVPSTPGGSL